ncbi:MAG: alpha-hydroxy-acid oxidizing protein [Chloroflexi bacterium]|nr:alpha-hydroxy-acid oxidizing protein [Chloroflexota bacterium]
MAGAQNLLELEALAREKLPPQVFDFIAGAAEDEITLARNREAWQAIQLLPRVLIDVSTVDTSATVLGQTMPAPLRRSAEAYLAMS